MAVGISFLDLVFFVVKFLHFQVFDNFHIFTLTDIRNCPEFTYLPPT